MERKIEMNLNTIHKGDCLDIMRNISDKSIDMILCDLPYGTTACKWDIVIPFNPLWDNYLRVLKDNGAIILFASQPFSTDLINSKRDWFRYELIWEKNLWSNFLNAKRQFLRAHESILVFYKSQPTYNPQFLEFSESTKKRYKQGDRYVKSEYTNNGTVYNKKEKNDAYIDFNRGRHPGSVLKFKCVHNGNNKRLHPSQKPVDLYEYLIKTYTNKGELVLDNCAGSGTSAIASMRTGRNFICIEKEDKYFEVMKSRIENEKYELFYPSY